jgi:hypothetical protein
MYGQLLSNDPAVAARDSGSVCDINSDDEDQLDSSCCAVDSILIAHPDNGEENQDTVISYCITNLKQLSMFALDKY